MLKLYLHHKRKRLIYILKKYFFLLLLSFLFLFLILIPFVPETSWRFLMATILSFFPAREFLKWKNSFIEDKKLKFLTNFIQLLTNEIEGGENPATALTKVTNYFLSFSYLANFQKKFLLSLNKQLNLKIGVADIFNQLSNNAFNKEAKIIFNLLHEQSKNSGPLNILLSRLSQILREQDLAHTIFKSEFYKQKLESVILIVMPFFIAFFLTSVYPSFIQQAYTSFSGRFLILASLFLSLISILITNLFTQIKNTNTKTKNNNYQIKFLFNVNLSLKQKLLKLWPKELNTPFFQARAWQKNTSITKLDKLEDEFFIFIQPIFTTFIIILFISLVFLIITKKFLFLAIPPIFLILKFRNIFNDAKNYINDIEFNYAFYLSLLIALLNSAFVPRLAFEKALTCFEDDKNMLWQELNSCMHKKDENDTLFLRLNSWLRYLPLGEVQSSLKVLIQYLENGSDTLLAILEFQLNQLWLNQRNKSKKEMEKKSILLFFPMLINLLAIISFVMAPVISQFNL